ncbi:MAG: hypothetical protein ACKON7_03740 [Planctomycetaceae bacterium]
MRVLLIDHGCCDHPHTRVHALCTGLLAAGCRAAACGPSTVPGLERQPAGLHGIHLHDVAAATNASGVPARLLGLVRETARQTIAEATDDLVPDAIFVLHAGILADLAVETGVPVVVHVAAADLDAAGRRPSLRRLVAAAIGSSELVVAADETAAATLRDSWLDADAAEPERVETWPAAADSAAAIAAACRRAVARRRGE